MCRPPRQDSTSKLEYLDNGGLQKIRFKDQRPQTDEHVLLERVAEAAEIEIWRELMAGHHAHTGKQESGGQTAIRCRCVNKPDPGPQLIGMLAFALRMQARRISISTNRTRLKAVSARDCKINDLSCYGVFGRDRSGFRRPSLRARRGVAPSGEDRSSCGAQHSATALPVQ